MKKYIFLFFIGTLFSLMSCKHKEISVEFLNEECKDCGRCCNPQNYDDFVIGDLIIEHATLFDDNNKKIQEIPEGISYLNLKPGQYKIKYYSKVLLSNGQDCYEINGMLKKKVIQANLYMGINNKAIYKNEDSWAGMLWRDEEEYIFIIDDRSIEYTINLSNGAYKTEYGEWVAMSPAGLNSFRINN